MAAERLNKVRSKFIEKVSKPVIKNLLDDLVEDRVLNDGEIEDVLESISTRGDQARCLVDMVRKKGDRASAKMIDHLLARDPTLHSELGLSTESGQFGQFQQLSQPGQSGQTAPLVPRQPRPESSKLVPSTAELKAAKLQKGVEVYLPMDKSVRQRLALLITNIQFDNPDMNRNGAERDEENMERLLTDLGYNVVKRRNLSGKEMDDEMKAFSQRPEHSNADSTFVVIMSHGRLGEILGVHWAEYDPEPDVFPIDNIFTHLNTRNCKALLNKPKVIIIQACRGEKEGSVFVSDASAVVSDEAPRCPHVVELEEDNLRKEHKEKDFISFLSSTPDTVSFRHKENGSLLIQYIMAIFNTYACDEHILKLFTRVMKRFEEKEHGKCQMASIDRCTLPKKFYLFPGL